MFRSSRKVIPGWSPEVAKARIKVRSLKRLATKSGRASHWDQYKEGLKVFKKLVKKAKFTGWKDFTSKVESLQSVSRLSKVLQRVESGELGSLKRNDGTYTSTPEETLDLLADTLIPSTETPTEPTPRLWSNVDIPLVDSILSKDRLARAVADLQPSKAPGTDGIRPEMITEAWDTLGQPVRCIIEHSLLLGPTLLGGEL